MVKGLLTYLPMYRFTVFDFSIKSGTPEPHDSSGFSDLLSERRFIVAQTRSISDRTRRSQLLQSKQHLT